MGESGGHESSTGTDGPFSVHLAELDGHDGLLDQTDPPQEGDDSPPPTAVVATDELALVLAARGGDHDAFRALWESAERRAWSVCLRITRSREDAADALQETQIAVWHHLDRFQARCPFPAWVVSIAHNAALSIVRSGRRHPEEPLDPDGAGRSGGATVGPFADGVVEVLALQGALAALPESHRSAILLWASGLTYAQVGGVMGAPVSSVKVWIHRARTRLSADLAS